MRPVIALLSDFGTRDHYAGTMKGVMLGICPDVTLVDITHEITPHDVSEGALQLAASFGTFPPERSSSPSSIPASGLATARHRGRSRRLPVRRARQRRADRRPAGHAAEAGRGTDRAAVRAADREPDVRRARSVRARCRVAGQGDSAGRARAAVTDYQQLDIPQTQSARRELSGRRAAGRSFGNLVTNIDRRTFEAFSRGQPVALIGRRASRSPASSRPTPISARRSLRALRQHRPPRIRRQRRERCRRAGRHTRRAGAD